MPQSTSRKLLLGLGAVVAVVAVALLAAPLWLGPIVGERLVRLVDERSRGQYRLEVGDVGLGLLGGRLTLRDVALAPVDSTAERAAAAALTGGFILEAAVERAEVSGVSYYDLLTDARVDADSVTVSEPRVVAKAYLGEPSGPPDSTGGGSASIAAAMPGGMRPEREEGKPAISIAGLRMSRGFLDWSYVLDTAVAMLDVGEIDLLVSGIAIDSLRAGGGLRDKYDYFTARVGEYRHELPDSLHVVTLGAVTVDSRDGRVLLDGFRLRPRVEGFAFRQNYPDVPLAVEAASDSVALRGFDLGRFLRTGDYRARSLRVGQTEATVWVAGGRTGGAATGGGGVGVDLGIDSVDLAGVTLRYRGREPRVSLDLADADLLLTDVQAPLDSIGGQPLTVAEAALTFRDFLYVAPNTDQRVRVARGGLDYRGRRVALEDISFGPAEESAAIAANRATTAIEATEVSLSGVDLDRLFWSPAIVAEAGRVRGLDIRATTNVTAGAKRADRPELMLARLQRLGVPLAVDELAVEGAHVAYRQIRDDSDVTLDFADTYATFYHLGTSELYAREHPRCEVDIRTRFEDILPVRVGIGWPNAEGVPYRLEARTGELADLTRINDFLVPMANMKVERGALGELAFRWTADGRAGRGQMTATYSDFAIELLGDGPEADDRDVVSWLANLAAVKEDADGRTGPIDKERGEAQGMFGHWWWLIRDGLEEVALTGIGRGVTGG